MAFALTPKPACAQTRPVTGPRPQTVLVVELEGTAEFMARGEPPWRPLVVNFVLQPRDQVRVHARSRLLLRLSDQSTVRFSEGSEFKLDPPLEPKAKLSLNLLQGLLYLFHRDEPASIGVKHRTVSAAIRGTEFAFAAPGDGRVVLTLVEGTIELWNEVDRIQLRSGEQGVAEPGQAPVKSAVINAVNVLQWNLYYPAILNLEELDLPDEARQALTRSIVAYEQGDLLQALAHYPSDRTPHSDAEKIYLAALLLSVGQVGPSEELRRSVSAALPGPEASLAEALGVLVAAVKLQPRSGSAHGAHLSSEWVAESYYWQSLFKLPEARNAARRAVEQSPRFAFAWARLAELEFSFNNSAAARAAVEKSLQLAPRHAQALALQGFLLAAENKLVDALGTFDRAIALDGALGNAWLGRGLCKIRRGQLQAGGHIQVAATLEPQRALLRSYLSKAWSETGDLARAREEIELARQLDPHDPTAWLYSALLLREQNRLNEAVRDLENRKRSPETGSSIGHVCCSTRTGPCAAPTWPRFIRKPACPIVGSTRRRAPPVPIMATTPHIGCSPMPMRN